MQKLWREVSLDPISHCLRDGILPDVFRRALRPVMFCPVVNFEPINELVCAITCVVERKNRAFQTIFGVAIIPTAPSAHQINFVDPSCRFWQLEDDTPNQPADGRQRPEFDGTDGKKDGRKPLIHGTAPRCRSYGGR